MLAGVLWGLASISHATGLGAIQSQSALGQPLRVTIPLTLQSGEEVGCVRITGAGDDLPTAVNPRHSIIEQRQATRLEITTRQSVNEPVLNLTVTVGCSAPVTRSYVLLLDPPEIAELATTAAANLSGTGAATPSRNAGQAVSVDAPTRVLRAAPKTISRTARNNRRPASTAATTTAAAQSLPDAGLAKPAQVKSKAAQSTRAIRNFSPETASADRLVLSSRMEGTALRLSPELPVVSERPVPDAEQLNQLRQQQERMAATLNDQDPDAMLAAREATLASRVQRLTEEAVNLQKQIDALMIQNQSLERSRLPAYLVWILGVLALLALGFVAWVASRYRMLQQSTSGKPWWTPGHAEPTQGVMPETGSVTGSGKKAIPKTSTSRDSTKTTVTRSDTMSVNASLDAGSNAASRAASNKKLASISSADTLMPLGATTAAATDIGMLSRAANAMELTEHDSFANAEADAKEKSKSDLGRKTEASKNQSLPGSAGPVEQKSNALEPLEPSVPDAKVDPEQIDFMLDISSSKMLPVDTHELDFSIATDIDATQTEAGLPSLQKVTESFFKDMEPLTKTEGIGPASSVGVNTEAIALAEGMDDLATQVPMNLEQSSLHFRMVQFTSVIEQIEELHQKHDSARAIALLRRYVLREEDVPILMWLMLLEEYRQADKKAVYQALSEHFAKRYGRPMLKWDEPLSKRTPQLTLAQVPEIDENIKVLWGTQKGLEFINRLISATNQSDAIVFNAVLQRELLQLAPMYPLENISKV